MENEENKNKQGKDKDISEEFKEEFETLEYLSLDCPIFLSMLDCITLGIVYCKICENCRNREEAETIIKDIENAPAQFKYQYRWKNYSLGDLFNADYNYLVQNNIINQKLVPNENFFHSRFYYKDIPEMVYPLSAADYYLIFLKKKIKNRLDHYFDKKINKKT